MRRDPNRLLNLKEKWSPLLKGIKNPSAVDSTALVLENQEEFLRENKMLTETGTQSGTGFRTALDGFGDQAIDKFPKLVIPMVRRIMPQLIANEIFAVQPMEGPVGMAFSMRWVYDQTKTWTDPITGRVHTVNAGDEAYIPGMAGYPGHNPSIINPAYSGNANATDPKDLGYQGADGELLTDLNFGYDPNNYKDGTTAAANATTTPPAFTEGSLKIVNILIEARTRKLKASWSQEAVDDIKKVHSLNLEQEIVDFLSYQIQAEIDRELIAVAYGLGTANALILWDMNTSDGRWQEEKYKTFYHTVIRAINFVGHTTRRGPANWMICSSEVLTILISIKAFDISNAAPIQGLEPYEGGEGVVYQGTINNGKVKVYLDYYWQAPINNPEKEIGYCLIGYRGKKSWDSGIIYCPYIPVMLLKTIDPHNFHPLLSLGTRYAVVDDLLDTDKYYAVISVRDTSI